MEIARDTWAQDFQGRSSTYSELAKRFSIRWKKGRSYWQRLLGCSGCACDSKGYAFRDCLRILLALTAYSDVTQLVHFVRSPLWVMPPPQQLLFAMESEAILKDIKMDGDKYTPEQIGKFTSDPEYYLKFIKIVEEQINNRFPTVRPPQQFVVLVTRLTQS
jgi:hypothetical protein